MLHSSYAMGGIAGVVFLIGFWIIKRRIYRKNHERGCGLNSGIADSPRQDHDIEHRALIYLMTQKTDSVFAALARTIEQERQKLGVVVRNPSITPAMDAFQTDVGSIAEDSLSSYEQILPLVRDGITVATIARKLQLPEAEVSMIKRLNVA